MVYLRLLSFAHQALLVTRWPSSALQELPLLKDFSLEADNLIAGGIVIMLLQTEIYNRSVNDDSDDGGGVGGGDDGDDGDNDDNDDDDDHDDYDIRLFSA